MDMSKLNLLAPINQIESHLEVGFNLTELSPLYLHDSLGFCGTAFYDSFSSQLYFNGNSSYGYSDLMNSYSETLMNPNVTTPMLAFIPDENNVNVTEESTTSTNACQLEYPEHKYLQNEPTSPVDSVVEGVSKTSAQQTSLPNFEKNDNAKAQIAEQQEITYEATIDGQKVYPKPSCSLTYLIALALKNSRTGTLPVTEIYNFIRWQFPYYRTASNGWTNAVRHSLSVNSTFKKIETNSTTDNIIKRNNLWTIKPTKLDTINRKILKTSYKHSQNIRQAMLHPEYLEFLEGGEMKFGGGDKSNQDDFVMDADALKLKYTSECSKYQLVPVAKRRKTLTDLPPDEYIDKVVTRRKTPLTTETVTEPSFENVRVIDFSSHEF